MQHLRYEWPISEDTSEAGVARGRVAVALSEALVADHRRRDGIVLVTSELVTNAIQHGQPPRVLVVAIDASVARIAVRDGGRGFEHDRDRQAGASGGWGLLVAGQVADRFGRIVDDDGHTVFAEFDLR